MATLLCDVPLGEIQEEFILKIEMSSREIILFKRFLSRAKFYFEFGCGGSTVAACGLVSEKVISVDSSTDWLDRVRAECVGKNISPDLRFVDIGPTGEWGAPIDTISREKWPKYSSSVVPGADFYFVDGRFRVACFISALIISEKGSYIGIHDFQSRPDYHIVKSLCTEVASEENISIFIKDAYCNVQKALELYDYYKYIPN